ncbi:MAG: hypothetical protein ACXVHT_10845 [Methanobacterium sp.]
MVTLNGITFLCTVGVTIVIAVSVMGMIFSNGDYSITSDQKNVREIMESGNTYTDSVKILNQHLEKPFFSNWIVKGQVEKLGFSNEMYSMITVTFLDKYGNSLNSSSVKIDKLNNGEIKDFEVKYYGKIDPDSYKIEINSYN